MDNIKIEKILSKIKQEQTKLLSSQNYMQEFEDTFFSKRVTEVNHLFSQFI